MVKSRAPPAPSYEEEDACISQAAPRAPCMQGNAGCMAPPAPSYEEEDACISQAAPRAPCMQDNPGCMRPEKHGSATLYLAAPPLINVFWFAKALLPIKLLSLALATQPKKKLNP